MSGADVRPMPERHRLGPGRDRRFALPQFLVTLDGLRTAFFDAGHGPPLVFLHGLAGNLTHWVEVAPPLAARCRVIGLDLPGCGESEAADADLTVARYAEQTVRLLDALAIPRATLVGHSLGGMVATAVALSHPGRVDRIVVIDPAGFAPLPWAVRMGGRLVLRQRLLDPLLVRTWRSVLRLVFERDNEHTRAFVTNVRETYEDGDIALLTRVICGLRADYLGWDFGPMLRRLEVPVTLVWGEADRLVPARFLRRAADAMPDVTAEVFPRCGHMPIIECPEEVVRVLRGLSG